MKRLFILLSFLAILPGWAYSQNTDIIKGEIIIQLEEGCDINQLLNLRSSANFKLKKNLVKDLNIYQINYDPKTHFDDISPILTSNNCVKHFMQNQNVAIRKEANDKHFDKQWNLRKIGIEKAWDVTTGGETALGEEIVVAVLDSGFDVNLNDMFRNVKNSGEEVEGDKNNDGCPGDCGIDDDGDGKIDEDGFDRLPDHPLYNNSFRNDDDENGYIDDILGLNLANNTDDHPALNHGTAVAGIIGARGNNEEGVSGVNWNIKLLLLSKVDNVGQIIEAYEYVYQKRKRYNDTNGAKGDYIVVTNFSSGIDNEFGSDFPIWCNMYNRLGNIGVLSVGATTNKNTNVDEDGDLPTTCSSKYLIAVTNLTESDEKPSAGFGNINVDIGAPGNGTFTLGLGEIDDVGVFSGTSAATPHVAGAIALLYSIPCENFAEYFRNNPSKVDELKGYILNNVDPISDLAGKSVSEGRLNVYSTMLALKDFCPSASMGSLSITNIFPNPSYQEEITIKYDGPDEAKDYNFKIYNIEGKLVFQQDFVPPLYGERLLKIRPPTLAGGTYVISIQNSEGIVAKKHVIIPYLR